MISDLRLDGNNPSSWVFHSLPRMNWQRYEPFSFTKIMRSSTSSKVSTSAGYVEILEGSIPRWWGKVFGSCGCSWGNAVCVWDVAPPRMLVESEVWYWDSLARKCEVTNLWIYAIQKYICYGMLLFWYYFMLLFTCWCVFLAIGWNMATGCMVHFPCEPPGGGQQDAVNSSGPTCTAQPCTAGVRTSQLTSKSQNQSLFLLEKYAGDGWTFCVCDQATWFKDKGSKGGRDVACSLQPRKLNEGSGKSATVVEHSQVHEVDMRWAFLLPNYKENNISIHLAMMGMFVSKSGCHWNPLILAIKSWFPRKILRRRHHVMSQ